MSDAIAQQAQQMTPQQRAQGEARAEYLVKTFGTLARRKNLQLADVYAAARQAITDGQASPDEVNAEIGGLPSNPKQLRVALQQRFKAAVLSAAFLSSDPQSGAPPATPAQPLATPPSAPAATGVQ